MSTRHSWANKGEQGDVKADVMDADQRSSPRRKPSNFQIDDGPGWNVFREDPKQPTRLRIKEHRTDYKRYYKLLVNFFTFLDHPETSGIVFNVI